ncbi:MAG: CDP-glycerol glycerophosphotransferase family protein [Candidatus Neomarinimicrobiota bacterium]
MIKPVKIVFDTFHLYHLPQFDPIIELLRQDNRFEIYLTCSSSIDKVEYQLAQKIIRNRGLKFIAADSEQQRKEKIRGLNPAVFICGWSRYPISEYVPDSTLVGMVYHGIGVKPSYWRDNSKRLDIRFVEGSFREKQLKDYGIQTELAIAGYAKLDPLFNGSLPPRDQLLREWGLAPEKPTLLYAPTFYPSSLEKFGERLALDTREFNLIIKPHMWVYFLDRFGGVNLKPQRQLLKKFEKYRHIYIPPPEVYNIVPFYHASDLLITEASSTIYEMMALDKPVILCKFFKLKLGHRIFKNRLYKRRLDKNMSMELNDFCLDLAKPGMLKSVVRQALSGIDPNPALREKYKAEMLYQLDGKAAERIRAVILKKLSIIN